MSIANDLGKFIYFNNKYLMEFDNLVAWVLVELDSENFFSEEVVIKYGER